VSFEAHLRRAIDSLTRDALLRTPRVHAATQGAELLIDGSRLINLCSNDYLGLASDPALARAAADALAEHGLGAGSSRLVTGTHDLHRRAEARLARYVGKAAALLFATGYSVNVGSLPALASKDDVIFSDALNHASIIDGARLSRAHVIIYRHGDAEHLTELLAAHRADYRAALVATESLFSMDGDVAPLAELRTLCDRFDAGLYVDEAHALGVLGPDGRGLCAELGVTPDALVGTLGKAFGCSGAFIAGSSDLITLLENRARSFVFSTAAPHALAAAAIIACDLVEQARDRRSRVLANALHVREQLTSFGYTIPSGRGPIIPAIVGPADAAMALSRGLFERGVFVQGIRPPTVSAGTSRLRITPIATHTDAQLTRALEAFDELKPLAP
jgi:8-amino-7-oxononanoate synthase